MEITNESGEDPLDFPLNLSLEEDLGTTFLSVLLNSDEEAVGRLLVHPFSSIALSDAGAHLHSSAMLVWAPFIGALGSKTTNHVLGGKVLSVDGSTGTNLWYTR
ncbi:MAG: hypothetical protein CM1200mP39_25660 [Dehalococcoidia bacterium]|nr:MAG: hypothetical protein CM1200mP39_25660 [Dehalococcoidia bacterium]